MSALEAAVAGLDELVDGQEPWSHRKRLDALESDRQASAATTHALRELREVRLARSTRIREWGSFAIALAALVIAVLLR